MPLTTTLLLLTAALRIEAGACPSAAQIEARLVGTSTDTDARVLLIGDHLTLLAADGHVIATRAIEAKDCEARAELAGILIAAWLLEPGGPSLPDPPAPAPPPPPAEAARPPAPEPATSLTRPIITAPPGATWYGWQTALADGAGVALLFGALEAGSPRVAVAGGTSLLLGAPLIHLGHGGWVRAALSVVMRAIVAWVPIIEDSPAAQIGALLAGSAAIALDAGLLAWRDPDVEEDAKPYAPGTERFALELHLGAGTPYGALGAALEVRATEWFAVAIGGGAGTAGPQAALSTRFRWPLGNWALGGSVNGSLGHAWVFSIGETIPVSDGIWLGVDGFGEWRSDGGFVLRGYLGVAGTVSAHEQGAVLPSFGLSAGYAFDG